MDKNILIITDSTKLTTFFSNAIKRYLPDWKMVTILDTENILDLQKTNNFSAMIITHSPAINFKILKDIKDTFKILISWGEDRISVGDSLYIDKHVRIRERDTRPSMLLGQALVTAEAYYYNDKVFKENRR